MHTDGVIYDGTISFCNEYWILAAKTMSAFQARKTEGAVGEHLRRAVGRR